MRNALQSLPWVRKVEVEYPKKLARVTVEKKAFQLAALIEALEKAGFGGKRITVAAEVEPAKVAPADSVKPIGKAKKSNPMVTFHVIGMKKTKSGAT